MNCEICGKAVVAYHETEEEGCPVYVTIYLRPVCPECAQKHGIKCQFCGQWGLKGDDDFPTTLAGAIPIHRKCMDHQDAFNKRRTR